MDRCFRPPYSVVVHMNMHVVGSCHPWDDQRLSYSSLRYVFHFVLTEFFLEGSIILNSFSVRTAKAGWRVESGNFIIQSCDHGAPFPCHHHGKLQLFFPGFTALPPPPQPRGIRPATRLSCLWLLAGFLKSFRLVVHLWICQSAAAFWRQPLYNIEAGLSSPLPLSLSLSTCSPRQGIDLRHTPGEEGFGGERGEEEREGEGSTCWHQPETTLPGFITKINRVGGGWHECIRICMAQLPYI